jgi:hypothetical protein
MPLLLFVMFFLPLLSFVFLRQRDEAPEVARDYGLEILLGWKRGKNIERN